MIMLAFVIVASLSLSRLIAFYYSFILSCQEIESKEIWNKKYVIIQRSRIRPRRVW